MIQVFCFKQNILNIYKIISKVLIKIVKDVWFKKYSKLNNIYFVNSGTLTENYALVNIIHD